MMLTLFYSLCDLSLHCRYVYVCLPERVCTPALISLIFADFILFIHNNTIILYNKKVPTL